ncbi:Di-sulfide bridge nucleocytoplasmic transport domain protein (macronuclear) [Tetrahymena thermophila SB210]|uniref:Di-sulfide bridge nucleocytoplasmic transport domain protein n=1 Tax=Tetrahymena thermophila (strain SB210) TaxID=312017 RepID=I7M011_TETTS|nr:Di-sulfide bridge nucleocytoplasmic transport domain protein [Tetrahymena thermophila SB210]EAR85281.2 Di-sulfide bridge nucleocytoplasmic transport domain protein [Tetrahymena thermophila SB210]|eukprot:XP_001032944.2 Di-sulfide bridge nucleocytoplasmic transport domain protein [Tetrahymena thermophila SB210]
MLIFFVCFTYLAIIIFNNLSNQYFYIFFKISCIKSFKFNLKLFIINHFCKQILCKQYKSSHFQHKHILLDLNNQIFNQNFIYKNQNNLIQSKFQYLQQQQNLNLFELKWQLIEILFQFFCFSLFAQSKYGIQKYLIILDLLENLFGYQNFLQLKIVNQIFKLLVKLQIGRNKMGSKKKQNQTVKCLKCNENNSIHWATCPTCKQNSNSFQGNLASQRNRNIVSDINIKGSKQNQIEKYEERSLKNADQNQYSIVNQYSQFNFKFSKSFFKYSIMIIVLTLTLCILIHDMNGLRQKDLQVIINEIDQCSMNYDNHDCEKVISSSKITKEWKQMCIQWKICKDKDPYSEVQILKIMTLYFAGIMSLSFDQMNGKAIGIVLFIYFFGIILKHFLSCLCPRRKQ